MITPLCRFTYSHVFEPAADPMGNLKYSSGLMFPKSDTKAIDAVKTAIDAAITKGVSKGKFAATAAKSKGFKYPLRDGDEYYNDAVNEGDMEKAAARTTYRGMMFINASNTNPIGVVNKFAQPIVDQSEFYSGCWGHADVNFCAFSKNGNIGVGAYLNNVMKKKDDDRLDGKQAATTAFASVTEEYSEESDLQ